MNTGNLFILCRPLVSFTRVLQLTYRFCTYFIRLISEEFCAIVNDNVFCISNSNCSFEHTENNLCILIFLSYNFAIIAYLQKFGWLRFSAQQSVICEQFYFFLIYTTFTFNFCSLCQLETYMSSWATDQTHATAVIQATAVDP